MTEKKQKSRRLKVLLLSNMYPSEGNPAYGSFVKNTKDKMQTNYDVDFKIVVIRSHKKSLSSVTYKYFIFFIRSLASAAFGSQDIIYCHYLFPTGYAGLLAKKIARVPLVVTCHGSDVFLSDRSAILRRLTHKVIKKSDKLIIVSNYLADELVKRFPEAADKIEIINCGVDINTFNPFKKAAIKNGASSTFLFVGNLVKNKNPENLIKAFARLSADARLILVGDGPDRKTLIDMAHKLGVYNKVKFQGYVNKEELPDFYRRADVLVMPSLNEAFGLVALEAMACGLPVAASNVGGLKEFIKNGENGILFDPNDVTDINKAMANLILDERFRRKIAKKAIKTAMDNSVDKQVGKIYSVLRETAKRG